MMRDHSGWANFPSLARAALALGAAVGFTFAVSSGCGHAPSDGVGGAGGETAAGVAKQAAVSAQVCQHMARGSFVTYDAQIAAATPPKAYGSTPTLGAGWDGYKRIHHAEIDVEVLDGKLWIQFDGTEDGIAMELVAAGVPRDRIVLAFKHPTLRKYSDFAAA